MHTLTVFYKPDNYPAWVLWKEFPSDTFQMIGEPGALDIGGTPVLRPGFNPRLSFEKPPDDVDPTTKRRLRRGFQFQIKLNGSGHVVIDKFRLHAQKLVEKSRATI